MKKVIITSLAICLILSGCQTSTKIGDWLIPSHPRSNQINNEKVVIKIYRGGGGRDDHLRDIKCAINNEVREKQQAYEQQKRKYVDAVVEAKKAEIMAKEVSDFKKILNEKNDGKPEAKNQEKRIEDFRMKVKKRFEKDKDLYPFIVEAEAKAKLKYEATLASPVPGGGAVATWLAGQAVGFVAQEIKNESKKYKRQYSGKLREALKADNYKIVLYRLIGTDKKSAISSSKGSWSNLRWSSGMAALRNEVTNEYGGRIASAFVFDFKAEAAEKRNVAVAYLDLESVYIGESKAKIVNVGRNPFKWAAALVLKTGEEVSVDINFSLSSLTNTGSKIILNETYPANGTKINLSNNKIKTFKSGHGQWLLLQTYNKKMYIKFEVNITERDPSNIQKVLDKAAEKVEERGPSLLGVGE